MKFRTLALIGVTFSAFLLSIFIGCDETAPSPMDDPTLASQPDAAIQDAPENEETPMPASLRAALTSSRQEEGGPQYHAAFHGKLPTFTNGPHRLKAEMESDSLRIHPLDKQSDWTLEIRLGSISRGNQTEPSERATRSVAENRAEYRRGNVTEWYLNGPVGLEQGFDIQQKPLDSSEGELRLNVEVDSDLSLEKRGDELVLLDENGGAALRAFGLIVLDANGKELASRLETTGAGFAIVVDDDGAEYPVVVDPVWGGETKLLASDGVAGHEFAFSVSVSADTILVGAHSDGANGADSGSAYVFVKSGTTWNQQAKLTPSDGSSGDEFGCSVSLDGDNALIGANGSSGSGAAYVFTRSGTTWTQEAKLLPNDGAPGDGFGSAVSIDADAALVGAYLDDISAVDEGSAYVFTRSGTTWAQEAKLTSPMANAEANFGASVSLDGDKCLIGAFRADYGGNDSGFAFVYSRSGTAWSVEGWLWAGDGAANDYFGFSVALDGDVALIGAYQDDEGMSTGSAYVFGCSGSTWTQLAKLRPADGTTGDTFGYSVSLNGNRALIGAIWDDSTGINSGSAFLFSRSGTSWNQEKHIVASDNAATDYFGNAVSIYGDTAVVGAVLDDDNGNSSGSAYVFSFASLQGEPCLLGGDCFSGFCVDGVCCDTACGGGLSTDCQACSASAGSSQDGVCEDLDGVACDDGLFCNEGETCTAGVCAGGSSKNCSALDDQCNEGVCNETAAGCEASPINEGEACDDGYFCMEGETCAAGTCTGATAKDCSSLNDYCNFGECNEDSDTCEAATFNEGGFCDDGDDSTINDVCTDGVCAGDPDSDADTDSDADADSDTALDAGTGGGSSGCNCDSVGGERLSTLLGIIFSIS